MSRDVRYVTKRTKYSDDRIKRKRLYIVQNGATFQRALNRPIIHQITPDGCHFPKSSLHNVPGVLFTQLTRNEVARR